MANIKNFTTFARDCKRNLTPVLRPVLDGEPYSPLVIAREVDRIAYRYTGDESLIDDNDEQRKKKIEVVEHLIEFFHEQKDSVTEKATEVMRSEGLSDSVDHEDVLVCVFAQIILMSIVSKNPGFLVGDE